MLIPNVHSGGFGDPKMCIDVPTTPPLKSLYVVWTGEEDTNCICPLCDSADCVWNNCQYFNFTFTPELHVNATILNGIKNNIYNLCWSNLQRIIQLFTSFMKKEVVLAASTKRYHHS